MEATLLCPIRDRVEGGVGVGVEISSSSQNRVRVEFRLGLQVLLRVGYDPGTVSESCFLEIGHSEICAGAVATGDGAGIAGDVVSGVGSSMQRWRTLFRSATKTKEPKTNEVPSSNLVTTEARSDAIEINGGFSASSPTVGAKCRCFIPVGFSRGYPESRGVRLSRRELRTRR